MKDIRLWCGLPLVLHACLAMTADDISDDVRQISRLGILLREAFAIENTMHASAALDVVREELLLVQDKFKPRSNKVIKFARDLARGYVTLSHKFKALFMTKVPSYA